MPNYSTILDYSSVICLGHTRNVPLMQASSELVDGIEPHDQFYLRDTAVHQLYDAGTSTRGVPGVAAAG